MSRVPNLLFLILSSSTFVVALFFLKLILLFIAHDIYCKTLMQWGLGGKIFRLLCRRRRVACLAWCWPLRPCSRRARGGPYTGPVAGGHEVGPIYRQSAALFTAWQHSHRYHRISTLTHTQFNWIEFFYRWLSLKGQCHEKSFKLRLWGFRLGPTYVPHPLITSVHSPFNLLRLFKDDVRRSKTYFTIV